MERPSSAVVSRPGSSSHGGQELPPVIRPQSASAYGGIRSSAAGPGGASFSEEDAERIRAEELIQQLERDLLEEYAATAGARGGGGREGSDVHPSNHKSSAALDGAAEDGNVVTAYKRKSERDLIIRARSLKQLQDQIAYQLKYAKEQVSSAQSRGDRALVIEAERNAMLLERDLTRVDREFMEVQDALAAVEDANARIAEARRHRERQIALAAKSRRMGHEASLEEWHKTEKESELKIIKDAMTGLREAKKRVLERQAFVAKQAERIGAELQDDRNRKVASILGLRKNTEVIRDKLRERSEIEEKRKASEQGNVDQEIQSILAAGGNPYEVFRAREERAKLDAFLKKKAVAQRKREQNIVSKIALERDRELARLAEDAKERHLAKQFVLEKHPDRIAEKISAFVASKTMDGRDIVDPTGRATRIDASKVMTVKNWKFGATTKVAREDILKLMQDKFPDATPDPRHAYVAGSSDMSATYQKNCAENKSSVDLEDDIAKLATQKMAVREFGASWVDPALLMKGTGHGDEDIDDDEEREGEGEGEGDDGAASGENAGGAKPKRQMSKLEKQYMAEARHRHKNNLTTKQVVWGKEFVGQAFLPSPSEVHFRDFDVGKEYSTQVVLTNVSYTFNTFKLLPLDDAICDYFDVQFALPGAMSAGTACTLSITFRPKVNKDIDTVIPFLAQTGAFEVPLHCSTKKCVLSSSPPSGSHIEFGDVVLAETETREIVIRNDGALDSEFSLRFVADTNAFTLVPNDGGFADPFSSCRIKISYLPMVLGPCRATLHVDFKRPGTGSFVYDITGVGADVPIYVDRPLVDLRCCRSGVLYRDKIRIFNRSTVAMKVSLRRKKSSRAAHDPCDIVFVPSLAFVQAGEDQSLEVQIKFTGSHPFCLPPDPSLPPELQSRPSDDIEIDEEIELDIPEQSMPVSFRIKSLLTPSVLNLSTSVLDFGTLSTQMSVSRGFTVRNISSLPRTVYFSSKLPQDVLTFLPSGGAAVVLPLESRDFTAIWTPKYAGTYDNAETTNLNFSVCVEDGISESYRVACLGRSVEPMIVADKLFVRMKACARGDQVSETIVLKNATKSSIVGCDFASPVATLTVSPRVFDLSPGESKSIVLTFSPPFSSSSNTVEEIPIVCNVLNRAREDQRASDVNLPTIVRIATAVVEPQLVLSPSSDVNFDSTSVLSCVSRTVYLENTSTEESDFPVECEVMDPHGCFSLVSALPTSLKSGTRYPITFQFSPILEARYRLKVRLRHKSFNSIEVSLSGRGVVPVLDLNPFPLVCVGDLVISPAVLLATNMDAAPPPPAKGGKEAKEAPSVLEKDVSVTLSTSSPFVIPVSLRVESLTGEPHAIRVIPEQFDLAAAGKKDVRIRFAPAALARKKYMRYGLYAARVFVSFGGQKQPKIFHIYGFVYPDVHSVVHSVPSVTSLELQMSSRSADKLSFDAKTVSTETAVLTVEFAPGESERRIRVYGNSEATVESTHKAFKVDNPKLAFAAAGESKEVSITFSPSKDEEVVGLPSAPSQKLRLTVEGALKISYKSGKVLHVAVTGELSL
eukprot:ANDGO_06059.mRNA.1 Cilia- and flagella-associated protein 74